MGPPVFALGPQGFLDTNMLVLVTQDGQVFGGICFRFHRVISVGRGIGNTSTTRDW